MLAIAAAVAVNALALWPAHRRTITVAAVTHRCEDVPSDDNRSPARCWFEIRSTHGDAFISERQLTPGQTYLTSVRGLFANGLFAPKITSVEAYSPT